jgi:hypothetical protein
MASAEFVSAATAVLDVGSVSLAAHLTMIVLDVGNDFGRDSSEILKCHVPHSFLLGNCRQHFSCSACPQ